MMAHLAKITGRPVKIMLPKEQELAQLQIKPETITKFRIGYRKDGQIVALDHQVFVSCADLDFGVHADGPGNAANQTELYTSKVPHWRSTWSAFRTNAPRPGPSRSHIQQETKWSWENMIDEMADINGIDPVQYRMMHVTQLTPGDKSHYYQTMPTAEVLREGSKAFGWEKRNPVAGGNPGRFKRGFGLAMSQHHGGNLGYHEAEPEFAKLAARPSADIFTSELDLTADGKVTMKIALPDSGSNAATALAAQISEMLGFTTRDHIKLVWGDSDLSPLSDEWGGAIRLPCRVRRWRPRPISCARILLARAARGSENRRRPPQDSRRRDFVCRQSAIGHYIRRARAGESGPDSSHRKRNQWRGTNLAQQGLRRVFRGGGGRYLDRRLEVRPRRLHARYRPRRQSSRVGSRYGGRADGEHAGCNGIDPLGSRIPRDEALQRRVLVVSVAHHHGHSENHAGVHR